MAINAGVEGSESMSAPQAELERSQHFANVLNYLFVTRLKEENGRKRPYKLREVAEGSGVAISYLSEARRGNIEDPHMQKVVALAKFFGVSPTIFLNEANPFTSAEQAEAAATETRMRDALTESGLMEPSMLKLLLRAGSYSPVERAMVVEVMDTVVEQWRAMDGQRRDGDQGAT